MRRLSLIVLCAVVSLPAWAGLHDKIMQRQEESAKQAAPPSEITKAQEVSLPVTMDKAWDASIQALKAKGLTVDKADKDIGQITTELLITNAKKPNQHAMRYSIDLRKIGAEETGVRVAALEQTRMNVFAPEPWGVPKYNQEESANVSKQIQDAATPH